MLPAHQPTNLRACRERQKATISSLEAEVTAKLAELQVLSQENEMLKLRSAVLEAVTSGREYHVSMESRPRARQCMHCRPPTLW